MLHNQIHDITTAVFVESIASLGTWLWCKKVSTSVSLLIKDFTDFMSRLLAPDG